MGDYSSAPPRVSNYSIPPRSQSSFAPGDVLGGVYRIRTSLNQASGDRMYEADDLILNRRVAIKVPRAGATVEELLGEARALAALSHPRLPEVHAAGRHDEMRFLIMELLVGVNLDQHRAEIYQRGHPLTLDEAVGILVDICDGLNAIHKAGIAHRDVKPDNVMLCGKRGTVIIDFSLMVAEADLSRSDDVLYGGSPSYMAPEALTMNIAPGCGHLSDLYSLGVLAYELITGSVPFAAGDIDTLARLHCEAPIPDARVLRPNLPAELAELISELMAKQPGGRPQASDEVLWRLRSLGRRLAKIENRQSRLAMVVSDDLGLAGELGLRLGHWFRHVQVSTHHSWQDGLKELESRTPDLLLLDHHIANQKALAFLEQMRKAKFAPPEAIIVLSERAGSEELAALRKLEVRSILPRGKMMGAMLEPIVRNVLGMSGG